MKRLITAIAAFALLALSFAPAHAALPWGAPGNVTVANSEVSGATPTCTYSSTLFVCIEDMTANVTSLTLAGMTAGTYYTLIWMQDGTGSRTLTQSAITQATGGPAVPAIPSAANKYTAWVILATSATAATFVANYDNSPLWDSWNMTVAGAGTTVTAATIQAQTTVVAPGMTANNNCTAVFSNPDANYNKGLTMGCVPGTNSVVANIINPTAANATPTAGNILIRIAP